MGERLTDILLHSLFGVLRLRPGLVALEDRPGPTNEDAREDRRGFGHERRDHVSTTLWR